MDAFAPVSDGLLSFAHTFRMELGFLISFTVIWFLSPPLAGKSGKTRSGAKVAVSQKLKPQPETTTRHRNPPPRSEHRSSPGNTVDFAVDLSSPSPIQLCDAKWVTAAVLQLCPTQMQRAMELYRGALRVGLDLGQLPAAEGAHLFMALVTAAIRVGQMDDALCLLRDCRRGPGTSAALFASCTKLCTSKQLFMEALKIYDFFSEDPTVISEDRSVWSCLVFCAVEARAYCRCQGFFEGLKLCGVPSSKDFGNMIRCASAQGDWRRSLALIQEMRQASVDIDNIVYNTALATCVAAHKTDEARTLLDEMEMSEKVADVVTYNTLCKGYARAGKLDHCFELFKHMRSRSIQPSQVTYGILLDCCINEKQVEKAAEIFNEMSSQGLVMNTVLYTTLIKGFARAEEVDQAMRVYKQMCNDRDKGVSPDLITFSILIKANCDAGRLEEALGLLGSMTDLSLRPDEVIFNNLLSGCVRKNSSELAKSLYSTMVEGGVRPSNATFSILIRLYAQNKLFDEAMEMLKREPKEWNVEAEPRLFVQLAQACLRERQGRRAVEAYKLMLEYSPPTVAMHGSLLGMCSKLNMLETAAEILTLAAEHRGRVDARDAAQVRDMAARKRKAACVESIDAAMARLGLKAVEAA